MAVKRTAAIPSSRQAIAVFKTDKGEVVNVIPSREFYRLLAQWFRLLNSNGVLAKIEDDSVALANDVAQNTSDIIKNQTDINTNNTSIAAINADLVIITNDISTLAADLALVSASLASHVTQMTAHGSNGDIVGFNDLAGPALAGLVEQASDVGAAAGWADPVAQGWANTLRANLKAAGIMA